MALGDALDGLGELLDAARAGDRRAEKSLLFAYRYGQKRDPSTGNFRLHTAAEIERARQGLLGMTVIRTTSTFVQVSLDKTDSGL